MSAPLRIKEAIVVEGRYDKAAVAAVAAVVSPRGKLSLPLPRRIVKIKRPLKECPLLCINGTATVIRGACPSPKGKLTPKESCRSR